MSTSNTLDIPEKTTSHPRYDAYKDSGVEWLGEIPEHWKVVRLKFRSVFKGGGTPSKDNRDYWSGDIPWVSPKDMKVGEVTDTEDHITPTAVKESSTSLVAPGSVLIVVRSGILKHTIPVATNKVEVALNQDLKAVTPDQRLDSRYLAYLIRGKNDVLLLEWTKSGTTVESLEHDRIANTQTPIPPLPEQRAIAAYLDRETERIDTLVAKKERLIKLLEEKRTALISHAVTKGLDDDAEMKDSGIGAIGQTPSHWRVKRNKWLFEEADERSETGDEELLTVSHKTGITPRSEKQNVNMIESESTQGYKVCYPGELVINTMWAWMGALGISAYHGVISPSYNVYRLREDESESVEPRYLDYLYRTPSYITEINRYSVGVWKSRLRLYPDAFFLMKTPLPPLEEQRCILDKLDAEIGRIANLIEKVHDGIDRLKEYRTALISAVVTGQIDVREKQ
jgi:type I restriction enzyme S subunit